MKSLVIPAVDELLVTVVDRDGRVLSRFDFAKLAIDPQIASAFSNAFVALYGHTSLETQRQSWRCIRKFVSCNNEEKFIPARQVPENALVKFREWLVQQTLSNSTRQSQFNVVLAVLNWCSRNHPEAVSRRLKTAVALFARNRPKERNLLEAESVKVLLRACYEDIERVEKKFEITRRLLTSKALSTETEQLAILIKELLALGGGRIPTQKVVHRSKHAYAQRVVDAGGLRYLNSLLMLSPSDLFPFYLAILIQTSGNPMAIRLLTRDCVRMHALRTDLELICWTKPRSNREQKVDFPSGRAWSAPSIVRRLLQINENLVATAEPAQRNFLFLSNAARKARVPCIQMLHILLGDFMQRHQITFDFDFKDLRRAGAKAHQKASSSLRLAQKRLNHRNIRTTALYIDQQWQAEGDDRLIVQFQGELVRQSLSISSSENGREKPARPRVSMEQPSETVFGFQCKDPYAGTAKGARPGELCEQFHRCATCPGALIVLDDPAVVARLLDAHKQLVAAKERSQTEGWWPRYQQYYLPTLRILEAELLPAVSPGVIAVANEIAVGPMIRLE